MKKIKEIFSENPAKLKASEFFSILRLLTIIGLLATAAFAQTTSFTYQGKLNEGDTPASASYDMQFRLFNASAAGNQIGTVLTLTNVSTTAGVFTVQLDFGAAAFDGSDRFLEIGISRAGQSNYTTLAPRQKINSAPYAIRSVNALTANNALQLNGTAANQFVQTTDSRLSDDRSPLSGSGNYIQNTNTQQGSANFNIGGTGAANVFNAAIQFNLNGSRILGNPGSNNLFAGNGAGSANTTGSDNSFFGRSAGLGNTSGYDNSFFGYRSGEAVTNTVQNSFFGSFSGLKTTLGGNGNSFFGYAAGYQNTSGSSNTFVGNSAGYQNTTGIVNTFLGNSAGYDNTTGNYNIFIGNSTGNTNVSTQVNSSIAIGNGIDISTSNTMVLGSGQTTMIPGVVKMQTGNNTNPNTNYGVAATFNSGFTGFIAQNLIFRELAQSIPNSPVHACIRSTSIGGGDGGWGLTGCTTAFSSVKNKTDVQPFTNGLEIIKRLNPVAFKWRTGGVSDVGLNAEDVAKVAPQIVSRNDKGEAEEVNEGSLNVLFINAIKEQQKQIEAQTEQIKKQQQQIEALKKSVCETNSQAAICKEEKK